MPESEQQEPDSQPRISSVRVVGLTAAQYDALPEEEQVKHEQPVPEDELREWEAGKMWAANIDKRRAQLFANVMDIPEVDWLVEGVAVKDGITLLYGDAGIGKTSLTLQLIGCVTEVRKFLGLSTRQVRVLLIEQDEGGSLLRSHVERMMPAFPSLYELQIPQVHISWNNDESDFEGKGKLLEELIIVSFASIVIIDSLSSLGMKDINHPSTGAMFDRLRAIANQYHCAFVVLHHTNKSGDVMGSNLIKGKVDVILHLEQDKLIFEKLRGTTPDVATVKPGESPFPHMSLSRDQNTLTFSAVTDRANYIDGLLLKGMPRSEIIDSVCVIFGMCYIWWQ
jgi:predicted ATP-dependent serine protease